MHAEPILTAATLIYCSEPEFGLPGRQVTAAQYTERIYVHSTALSGSSVCKSYQSCAFCTHCHKTLGTKYASCFATNLELRAGCRHLPLCSTYILRAAMAPFQVKQSAKLHVLPTVLKQQRYALAVSEAGRNGLQQHATRLRFRKATCYSRFSIPYCLSFSSSNLHRCGTSNTATCFQLWYQQSSKKKSDAHILLSRCQTGMQQKKSGSTRRVTQVTPKWFSCTAACVTLQQQAAAAHF